MGPRERQGAHSYECFESTLRRHPEQLQVDLRYECGPGRGDKETERIQSAGRVSLTVLVQGFDIGGGVEATHTDQ